MLKIVNVPAKQLPAGRDKGFRIMDGGEVVAFSHWHDDPVEVVPGREGMPLTAEVLDMLAASGVEPSAGDEPASLRRVGFVEAFAVLPERLIAMGYEDQVDAILGEVMERFASKT